jgi:hypothetical protein
LHDIATWRYSQGGVKFPTGGMQGKTLRARERNSRKELVSRSGEMPEPTVIVRMKENAAFSGVSPLSVVVIALGGRV